MLCILYASSPLSVHQSLVRYPAGLLSFRRAFLDCRRSWPLNPTIKIFIYYTKVLTSISKNLFKWVITLQSTYCFFNNIRNVLARCISITWKQTIIRQKLRKLFDRLVDFVLRLYDVILLSEGKINKLAEIILAYYFICVPMLSLFIFLVYILL